jgi:hypothetical protein
MFDFIGEILLGMLIGVLEAIGELLFDGVFEAIAKIPVVIWNALQTMRQEFWR